MSVQPSTTAEAVIRTLLLTDLVDSTKLIEKLGDVRAFKVATRHDRTARDLLPRFNGLEIDKTDGFLLLFERPLEALGYALAYHQALAELSVELGVQLRARAGIHLGEVFLRENDPEDVARGAKPLEVEGLAKPTAARAMSLAGGKQTLVTRGAFDMARQAATGNETFGGKLRWLAHGPYLFKGVAEPVEIFEVGVEGLAPLAPPADTGKARREVAAGDEITLGWRPAPGLEIPRRSGWMLEKELGEGGFGEVWLARQTSIGGSRVFKFCYDAEKLRTLKREVTLFRLLRESLGDRREIVRILDWSFDEAPYFLEEEYVGGGDLCEWSDEQGGLAAVPLETRLEIIAQVADALAAAHSVGVLHKDVKPANVLIATDRDGRPWAKLADFGVGEVVDTRDLLARGITVMGLTEVVTPDGTSSIAGSRLYRAPEVTEGRPATVQADVYALGVLLYQVVVGDFRRALASGWQRDVSDDLLAEDIASFVDGAPEHRPASAREVADRLRNLEARRAAREAERRERAEAAAQRQALERAQRRRKLLAVVATAATVVLFVVSVLAVQAVRARREAEAARGVAEQRRGQAEGLISFMLGDLRAKLEPLGRLAILDDVGGKALDYFAAVPEAELSDQELLSRSRTLYQIGDVRIAQGRLDEALAPLEESLALARTLVERNPDDGERLFELGQSHFWVGYVDWLRGDLDAALRQFQAYLEVSERLVEIDPKNLDWQLELAYAHSNIGSVLQARGDLGEALEKFRATLGIKRRLASTAPDNASWQLELARTYNSVGKILEETGELDEALRHYRSELEIKEALVASDPSHSQWQFERWINHNNIGVLVTLMGQTEEALEHHRAALEGFRELVARDASNRSWQQELAATLGLLGNTLRLQGDLPTAREYLEAAVEIQRRLVAEDPEVDDWQWALASNHAMLGFVFMARDDLAAGLRAGRTARDILARLLAENPEDRDARRVEIQALLLLGTIWERRGDVDRARDAWQKAAEIAEPVVRDSSDSRFLDLWARSLLHLGRVEQASPIIDRLKSSGYREPEFQEAVSRLERRSTIRLETNE